MSYVTAPAVIAAVAIAVAGFGAGWSVNGWRLDAAMARQQATQAEKIAQGVKDALETTTALQGKKDRALSAARDRELALSAAAADAAAESNRLRDELSRADARIANATDAAVRQYAVTANAVLADLERAGEEISRAAGGHASDVRTLLEAWPEGAKP